MAKRKASRRQFLYIVAAGIGVAAAIRTEQFKPEEGDVVIAPGGGAGGAVTPTATSTPTATPVTVIDLIVNTGEVYSVPPGNDPQNENYRHAKVGGTVRNGGTIQTDGTDS